MAKISNTRFPHTCEIYRVRVNPFGEDERIKTIYKGECRIYANTSIRIFHDNTAAGRVVAGDQAIAIPLTIEDDPDIGNGDLFDAVIGSQRLDRMVISDHYIGTMGTIVGFSNPKN